MFLQIGHHGFLGLLEDAIVHLPLRGRQLYGVCLGRLSGQIHQGAPRHRARLLLGATEQQCLHQHVQTSLTWGEENRMNVKKKILVGVWGGERFSGRGEVGGGGGMLRG